MNLQIDLTTFCKKKPGKLTSPDCQKNIPKSMYFQVFGSR